MLVFICAVVLSYTVLGIGVESYDRIPTCIDPFLGRVERVQRRYKKINRCVCDIVPSNIIVAGVACVVELVLANCLAVLVISLTVVEYFSKRVINDLIKSEVSTGVGIFLLKSSCQTGSEQR